MQTKLFMLIALLLPFPEWDHHPEGFTDYKQSVSGISATIEMVAITGGSFMMGAANDNYEREDDEKPAHEVTVDDFWMGKYEITWDQYDAFANEMREDFKDSETLAKLGIDGVAGATTPYVEMSFGMGKGTHPAINMTHYGALMFCKWLSAQSGVFYRLPTEAEWEYVCKKGSTDSENALNDIAYYAENSDDKYGKTGSKTPNALGIYDMLGNVSEWVMDQYHSNYYEKSPQSNPWNKPTTLYPRSLRGGSWKDTADKLCCTARQKSDASWKQQDPQIPKSDWWHTDAPFIGFRIVRPRVMPAPEQIKEYWLEPIEDFGMN